jgi:hypothetical protein
MPDAERRHNIGFTPFGVDIQMGYSTLMIRGHTHYNEKVFAEGDYSPSAVRGLAQ